MNIHTVAVGEQQIEFRGTGPDSIIIALADGRLITIHKDITEDVITVHGPDMETLLETALPGGYPTPAVRALIADAAQAVEQIDPDELERHAETESEMRMAYGDR